MSQRDERRSLDLPGGIVDRIERRLPRTDFDTPEAYVTYVMREVLYYVESETDEEFEAVDEADVRDRLRSLGYLNE
ncbi:hypothetical protein BRC93_08940 [Halobacteriales archaeon QS_5_70_15]|jgi:hypothetical protein|nr:MAG: hypothetical protein BRC93_08940 [Halobacteriales archaeon QS_5_70_15]